jgi:hypothetical protein
MHCLGFDMTVHPYWLTSGCGLLPCFLLPLMQVMASCVGHTKFHDTNKNHEALCLLGQSKIKMEYGRSRSRLGQGFGILGFFLGLG